MAENKVYILLTNTGSLLTKLIKLYTKKPYNHASIAFDSNLNEVYSFGRKNKNNPFDGGFVREEIAEGLLTQADCMIYSLTVSELEMESMRTYIKEMENQKENLTYNFIGLFGFPLNKPIKRKNAYFCSEFVASVIEKCNNIELTKPTSLISPSDLLGISNLQFEYEGMLKDYHKKDHIEKVNVPTQLIPVGM